MSAVGVSLQPFVRIFIPCCRPGVLMHMPGRGRLASRCTCRKAAWLRALSLHGSHDHGPISICVNLR